MASARTASPMMSLEQTMDGSFFSQISSRRDSERLQELLAEYDLLKAQSSSQVALTLVDSSSVDVGTHAHAEISPPAHHLGIVQSHPHDVSIPPPYQPPTCMCK